MNRNGRINEMINHIRSYYQFYYISLLGIMVVCIPLSRFVLSICTILLPILLVLEGNLQSKIKTIYTRKSILVLLLVFIVHLLGLLYTSNFQRAMVLLNIKLPLLIFPIIIGVSGRISVYYSRIITLLFIFAVFISTLISFIVYLGIFNEPVVDIRRISVFFNHIRLSLFVDMCIFSILYFLLFEKQFFNKKFRKFLLCLLGWFVYFIFLLQSLTGIIILFLVGFVFSVICLYKLKKGLYRILLPSGYIIFTLFFIVVTLHYSIRFFTKRPVSYEQVREYTARGNKYSNNFHNKETENGHYVWLHFCEAELKPAWNEVSKIKYDSLDRKGQPVKYTLIRYLTSKGLPKDYEGVMSLDKEDIEMISRGNANVVYRNPFGYYHRLYETLWQLDHHTHGADPSGQSVSRRFESYEVGFWLMRKYFWTGVGTGDLIDVYHQAFDQLKPGIQYEGRAKGSNQFVSYFIKFGIIGFLVIIFAFIYPVFYEKKQRYTLLLLFLSIVFFSMFNEDTLNYHEGINFFAFFYCLWVYALDFQNHEKINIPMYCKKYFQKTGTKIFS